MFSRSKPRHRKSLRMESLDDRIVLSVNPVAAGAGEVPDTIVQQQGEVVFVFGSDEDNLIQLQLGTETHRLTVDGNSEEFDATQVKQVVILGGVGDDEVQVQGTELSETAVVRGGEAELLGPRQGSRLQYQVRVRDAETIRFSASQGTDTAKIYDSPQDDEIFLHDDFATYVNSQGETMKLTGFERVEAYAENGGFDRVNFYDTPNDDRFVAKETFSYMVGNQFLNYAKGFERVDAYHREGGADEARLFDSAGDDVLMATPTQVVFQVGDTTQVTHNYPVTRAIASSGNDRAELRGQLNNDEVFVWDPQTAFMFSTGESALPDPAGESRANTVNLAVGFDVIEAQGNSTDNDRAELKGSEGNDVFFGLPTLAELSTEAGQVVEAGRFSVVRAFGNGGVDRAELTDSEFNDTYVGKRDFAYMEGGGRYLNYVEGFEAIDAISRNGGFDFAHVQEYRGPNEDYLIHDGLQFLVYGPNRSERVYGFSEARGDSEGAGWQVIRSITNPFTLGGAHDNTQFPDEDQIVELQDRLEQNILFVEVDSDESLNGSVLVTEERLT